MIVIGTTGLVLIMLYVGGLFTISPNLLYGVVDGLTAVGLIVGRAFSRSYFRHRNVLVLPVIAYLLAAASFIYSYINREAWELFLIGIFLTLLAAMGMLIAIGIRRT